MTMEKQKRIRRAVQSEQRIERHLERIRALLQYTIRSRGFTQKDIQEALGWGHSFISQLLNGQKSLRLEQVLMILNVIDVTREEFFGQAFQLGTKPAPAARPAAPALSFDRSLDVEELTTMRTLVECLAKLLIESSVIDAGDLERAVAKHRP